jgi:hypothetical protein
MGTPEEPKPVKLFAALLAGDRELFPAVENRLSALFGPIEAAGDILSWSVSDYYEREMGRGLLRRFVSFERLISPETLAELKLKTQGVEESYRRAAEDGGGRRINIDPGYLDAGKVALASTKGGAHRIYLRAGIYAEATLLYYDGSFHPFLYTYPDYLWPESAAFFAAARSRYLDQLRQNAKALL